MDNSKNNDGNNIRARQAAGMGLNSVEASRALLSLTVNLALCPSQGSAPRGKSREGGGEAKREVQI